MPDICLGTSLFLWYDFEYRKVCKINAYVLQTLLSKLFWLAVKEIITNQKPLDMKKLQAFRLLFATTQIITCKVFKLFDHSNITLIMSFKVLPSVSILLQDSFFFNCCFMFNTYFEWIEQILRCNNVVLSVLHLKSPTRIFKVKFNVILRYDGQRK